MCKKYISGSALFKSDSFVKNASALGRREFGAATVELTFALFILIGVSLTYWEFVAVFFTQQRVNHATYMAERSNVVGGNASAVAAQLNRGGQVTVGSGVTIRNRLNLPVNLNAPWDGKGVVFTVEKQVRMPREPVDLGDNAR